MTELNERQLELYKYLVEEQQHTDFVSKVVLMLDLDKFYHRRNETSSPYNSTAYRQLRKDIEMVNKSNAQYVILSVKEKGKLKGYKLADRNEEIIKQADKLEREGKKKLATASALRRKVKNDSQFRISGEEETKEIKSTIGRQ